MMDGFVNGRFHITDNVSVFTTNYQFIVLDYLYPIQITNITSIQFQHNAGNGIVAGTKILIEKK